MGLSKIDMIRDALLTVSENVWHYKAMEQADKYIVWAEDGEGKSVYSNNQKIE